MNAYVAVDEFRGGEYKLIGVYSSMKKLRGGIRRYAYNLTRKEMKEFQGGDSHTWGRSHGVVKSVKTLL